MTTMLRALIALCAMLLLAPVSALAAPLSHGDLLVAELGSGQIRHFSAAGADLGVFASGLNAPGWVTSGPDGGVYVTEYGARRVIKFDQHGVVVFILTTSFTPGGVAIGADGRIYVAEYRGNRLWRYAADGASISLFADGIGGGADFVEYDAASASIVFSDFNTGMVRQIGVDVPNRTDGFFAEPGAEGVVITPFGPYVSILDTGAGTGSGINRYSPGTGLNMGYINGSEGRSVYGMALDVTNQHMFAADYRYGEIVKFKVDTFENAGYFVGVVASGLTNPRDVHVWRAPKAALTLEQLIEDLNAAMLAVSRIRNAAVATRDAAARGEYIRMCTGVNYFRQHVDSQANNDVFLGPLDELRAAATNIGAALGCR